MLNIFLPQKSPLVAGYEFDAVLEDTLEADIELTRYPVESGANINDHRIINPMRFFITCAIGTKPMKPLLSGGFSVANLGGLAAGAASNLFKNNPLVATVAGMGAGFLAGSDATRGSSALDFFIQLMRAGLPFDVDAVDVQLKNMVITKLSRKKDPESEKGLILVLEIQELITLDRIRQINAEKPSEDQLNEGDPSLLSCVKDAKRGLQSKVAGVTSAVSSAVKSAVAIPTSIPPLL